MNDTAKKVPKLRFPGFSDEWVEKKLSKISKLTSSKRVYLSDYVNEGIPFYRGKEISELKQNKKPKEILYISQSAYDEFKNKFGVPKKNEILITAVGTLGNVLRIRNNDPFYFKDGNLIWLQDLTEDPYFMEILLQTKKRDLLKTSIGSSQQALTIVGLNKVALELPIKEEQEKIAGFLTAVDEKIDLLTKKKELLEIYKKGVMQQIFSQKIRFKDGNGQKYPDWQTKKLSEIGNTYNGLTGKSADDFGAGEPFITYKQIFDNSVIDFEKSGKVKIKPGEKQNTSQFGDIFFTTSSETPKEVGFASVQLTSNNAYLNSFSFGYRPIDLNKLAPEFARYLFRSDIFRRSMYKLAQGSTRYNISKIGFMKSVIYIPTTEEQKKIADFLSSIDEKIEAEERKLASAKEFKKALLQQMFV